MLAKTHLGALKRF